MCASAASTRAPGRRPRALPGVPGTVDVGGTTSVSLSDYIDTRGASGASGFAASGGANVGVASAGPVTIGTVFASGANADSRASVGRRQHRRSPVPAVATGQLWANGGNRTGASAGPGATGSLDLGHVDRTLSPSTRSRRTAATAQAPASRARTAARSTSPATASSRPSCARPRAPRPATRPVARQARST